MNNFVSIYKNRKKNLLQQADLDEKVENYKLQKLLKNLKPYIKMDKKI